ncbi:MAG: hypothetical protein DWP97_04355 [Calditrichaeota bacterium]|nr:MAG: hypothetical protein DWP97_04355 [Calditrichota bacterium]
MGKLLISYGETFLRELGAVVICGLIEENNKTSIHTFEKSGYKVEKEILYLAHRKSADS